MTDMRRKSIVLGFLLAVIFSLSLGSCGIDNISVDDSIEIYQLVIRNIYLEDNSFGKTIDLKILYIMKDTDDMFGDEQIPELPSQSISDEVMRGVTTKLSDLPLEVIWIDRKTKNTIINWNDGGIVEDGAIITLGNIRGENKSSVYVSINIYFANVSGSVRTYVLEREKGTWQIIGTAGPHIEAYFLQPSTTCTLSSLRSSEWTARRL